MRRFRPLLIVLTIAAALLSWWLVQREASPPVPQQITHEGPREIDYYLRGLDIVRMTAEGVPAHRLVADDLRHFTDDDTTELANPHLTVFQREEPPWEINAETAWVSADGSLILLSGAVLIDRAAGKATRAMRIETRDLRVQPDQDYAETDEKVRVTSDPDWLDAVGMQAWLRPPSRLKFLSKVKGHYVAR
jgi:lipopolysaccharide export system protein LptC